LDLTVAAENPFYNVSWPPKAIADTGDGLLKILTEIPSCGTDA
jgi:hypothetical protein